MNKGFIKALVALIVALAATGGVMVIDSVIDKEIDPGVGCDADVRICPDGTRVTCNPLTGEYGPCPVVGCDEDAKVCPDGTSVVRIPPNCEFAECPQGDGVRRTIRGSTVMGICPVLREDSDEICTAEVIGVLYLLKDGKTFVGQTQTDRTGAFSFDLNLYDGDYEISNQYSKVIGSPDPFKFPICSHRLSIGSGVNNYDLGIVYCDSGIQ